MEPVILFREGLEDPSEIDICRRYFEVVTSRVGIRDRLVVGRYSCLPFYKELYKDLELQGSRLINSPQEHAYIADFGWYEDLEGLTPRTWFRLCDIQGEQGPFVLKGRTNSRKHRWRELMYAESFEEARETCFCLQGDPLIDQQGVVFREYVPLRSFGEQLNGLPFSNEWRLFFLRGALLAYGYYWSNQDEGYETSGWVAFLNQGLPFAKEAASKVQAPFFVLDVAETREGGWIVIEVNDGQMSGLSKVDPGELYYNLREAL